MVPAVHAGRIYDAIRRAIRLLPDPGRRELAQVDADRLWALSVLVGLLGGADYSEALGSMVQWGIHQATDPYAKLPGMSQIISAAALAGEATSNARIDEAARDIAAGVVTADPAKVRKVVDSPDFGRLVGVLREKMPTPKLAPLPEPYPPAPPAQPAATVPAPPPPPPPVKPDPRPMAPKPKEPAPASSAPKPKEPAPAGEAPKPKDGGEPPASSAPAGDDAALRRWMADGGEWEEAPGDAPPPDGKGWVFVEPEGAAPVWRRPKVAAAPAGVDSSSSPQPAAPASAPPTSGPVPRYSVKEIMDYAAARVADLKAGEGHNPSPGRWAVLEERIGVIRTLPDGDTNRRIAFDFLISIGGALPERTEGQDRQLQRKAALKVEIAALRKAGPTAIRGAAEKEVSAIKALYKRATDWLAIPLLGAGSIKGQVYYRNTYAAVDAFDQELREASAMGGTDYINRNLGIYVQARTLREDLQDDLDGEPEFQKVWGRGAADAVRGGAAAVAAAPAQVVTFVQEQAAAAADAASKLPKALDDALDTAKTVGIVAGVVVTVVILGAVFYRISGAGNG